MSDEGWWPASQRDGLIERVRLMIKRYPERKVERSGTRRYYDNNKHIHLVQYSDPSQRVICNLEALPG